MKIYLVWIRYPDDTEDRIRGAALNWERAERMALNLEMHLKSQDRDDFELGIKSYMHGDLFVDSFQCENRWTKADFEFEEVSYEFT